MLKKFLFFIFLWMLAARHSPCQAPPGVRLVPGENRPLDFLVAGTNPANGRYFLLPEVSGLPETLEAELYGLDLEVSHGALFRKLPAGTRLFVGVPDPG